MKCQFSHQDVCSPAAITPQRPFINTLSLEGSRKNFSYYSLL